MKTKSCTGLSRTPDHVFGESHGWVIACWGSRFSTALGKANNSLEDDLPTGAWFYSTQYWNYERDHLENVDAMHLSSLEDHTRLRPAIEGTFNSARRRLRNYSTFSPSFRSSSTRRAAEVARTLDTA